MPNTKEKGKLIEVLSKHIPYGYATLCLIADELMAEGVTFATDNNVGDKWKPLPMTNADRIRAISDEELAELVGKYVYCGLCPLKHRCVAGECNKTVMEWLKQPAEEATNENISNPRSGDAHKN